LNSPVAVVSTDIVKAGISGKSRDLFGMQ